MFDAEHGIAVHAMQCNRASSPCEWEVSWFFSSCLVNRVYILELQAGLPCKTHACSPTSGLLSNCEGHVGILLEVWQGNRDASRREGGVAGSLSICHTDIGISNNFQEESSIISF